MTTQYELELEHQIAATPERVWTAWTTAAGLRSWWWPAWSPTISVDLRVGGDYRIEATQQGIAVHGRYQLIEPPTTQPGSIEPARLRFSWVWVDGFGSAAEESGPEETVDVRFTPAGAATSIALRHTGDWFTPEPAANYRLGWESVLETLSKRSSALR